MDKNPEKNGKKEKTKMDATKFDTEIILEKLRESIPDYLADDYLKTIELIDKI